MIKLPAREDGRWTTVQGNEKMPDLIATRNIDFDKEGYIKLSKPTIALFNGDDDGDMGLPILVGRIAEGKYRALTLDKQFYFDVTDGHLYFGQDTTTNSPDGDTTDSGACIFNAGMVFAENANVYYAETDDAVWTSTGITLSITGSHLLANFVSRNTLAAVDTQTTVKQYLEAWTSGGSTLTIPTGYNIQCLAYNRGYLAIGATDNAGQGKGLAMIWDGSTVNTNWSGYTGSNAVVAVVAYKDTFMFVTGTGQLLTWTGSGLQAVANFPVYFTGAYDAFGSFSSIRGEGVYTDGDIILINKDSAFATVDEKERRYHYMQPAGVWCYDDAVGLYHRFGTTAATIQQEWVGNADVNTTDNKITVSSAPDTGTPVFYGNGGSTSIGGLTNAQLYYTIKVDATTIKLATTYANALAGTAVDLTSAPNNTKETIATTAVDTTTDVITMVAPPDDLTYIRYHAGGGTPITGLTSGKTYMVDKTGATTLKLHEAFWNVGQTNNIDLTGTGNNAQTLEVVTHSLQFIPKSDFGQSLATTIQGGITPVGSLLDETAFISTNYFVGSSVAERTVTEKKALSTQLKKTENRGYVITSVMQSQQMQDDWQKLFIKHSKLTGEFDEIHVKYRTLIEDPVVQILYTGSAFQGNITWSDENTFTTTDTQFANVVAGDEVEVVQGAGSGYLLHVQSISVNTGTYTVNLTESVKNIAASDTARAIVTRWTYLTELNSGTITNEDGYSEITVGVKSKSIQFKIELRGEDVEIEEILVAHTLHKPVA